MFFKCTNLTLLDLSSFNTSNVVNMSQMFKESNGLTSLNLSSFDTSKVTNMYMMFYECSGLTSLDLSSFDTSNVIDMYGMFMNCRNLATLDVSKFDISKINGNQNMQSMFYGCNSLTHIKCTELFKNWCITNQYTIKLPTAMRDNGEGQWEIV